MSGAPAARYSYPYYAATPHYASTSARRRVPREGGPVEECPIQWGVRLAEHYCVGPGTQSFCNRVLGDVAGQLGASQAWILEVDPDAYVTETLAAYGDGDPGWRSAVALLSRLITGESAIEESATADGSRIIAVPLRTGPKLFGAVCLAFDKTASLVDETARALVHIARLLSVYLHAPLAPSGREEARRAVESKLADCCYPPGIVGRSKALVRVLERLEQIAPTEATVLIEGENGTGKELVARAIHRRSRRADKPWVVVNCAAIPEQLLESELFGHERGAFTGAIERRVGRFEQAHGGTVFLDEVGEMPPALQVKLLRVLQEKSVQRLGSGRDVPVDVRFVAATNRNLRQMKEANAFREDLYWRLYVVPLSVPPLRERPEDVEPLLSHFVRHYAEELQVAPPRIDRAVLDCLDAYPWPGNVRELQNLTHRLVILCRGGEILKTDLPFEMRGGERPEPLPRPEPFRQLLANVPATYDELQSRRRDLLRLASRSAKKLEDDFVDRILERHSGNKSRAAVDTGMHRTLIHRNLRKRSRSSPLLDVESLPLEQSSG